jgi:hypothetical protein
MRVSPSLRTVNRIISRPWIKRYDWSDTAFLLVDPIGRFFLISKYDWHLLLLKIGQTGSHAIKLRVPKIKFGFSHEAEGLGGKLCAI